MSDFLKISPDGYKDYYDIDPKFLNKVDLSDPSLISFERKYMKQQGYSEKKIEEYMLKRSSLIKDIMLRSPKQSPTYQRLDKN